MLDKRAYTEAFYIINEMSEEMRNKIPEKIIKNIENRMDKNYEFYVDEDNIENLELLEDTEKILSVLYTDYFSTDEEREIILNKEKILANSKKSQKIHDIEIHDVFLENKNVKITQESTNTHKEKWHEQLLNFIKSFLN